MTNFESLRDYWYFSHSVRNSNRYIFDDKVQTFIKAVSQTCRSRQGEIPSGTKLLRAQLGCTSRPIIQDDEYVADEEWPYPLERMVPIKGRSSEGRANPNGITYLYLANDKDTACAEVRPYKGAFVSVGVFKIKRELKVIDCTIRIEELKKGGLVSETSSLSSNEGIEDQKNLQPPTTE